MKFADLDQKLSYFLDDLARTNGEADYQFPLPLRIDGWNSAQETFGAHTLLEKTAVLSVPNGKSEIALPADFREMGLMYDAKTRTAYQRLDIFSNYAGDIGDEASYWVWGDVLRLGSTAGADLTIHYFADWPSIEFSVVNNKVAYTRDEVLVPRWSFGPLFHLTAAFCLDPQATRAAMDRNYDIKIASGTPIMNSRSQQAREEAWWYDYLIGKHRPQVRAVGAN